jgi:serine/threonine protein kinase
LSKSISAELKAKDSLGRELYGYNLTPRTGSIPFMAPEVAECKPYDEKCDVFSYAILLWEILALRGAFRGFSRREYLDRVCREKERLPLPRQWPPLTRLMIKEAWDNDPAKRPTMKRVAALVRGDLNELTTDEEVQNRTTHMRERSAHSARGNVLLSDMKAPPPPPLKRKPSTKSIHSVGRAHVFSEPDDNAEIVNEDDIPIEANRS